MTRPTSEQIDREIVDAAARTFAVSGYARTSVQELADAVGYSKTGLLHRFGSKAALYEAAVTQTSAAVQEVLDTAARHAAGPARARGVLLEVATTAQNHPGLVVLLVEALRPSSPEPGREPLHHVVLALTEMLAGGPTTPEQRLRIRLALKLVVNAVVAQSEPELRLDPEQLHSLIIELALPVLGDPVPMRAQEAS